MGIIKRDKSLSKKRSILIEKLRKKLEISNIHACT
jgi:hypothetical protein